MQLEEWLQAANRVRVQSSSRSVEYMDHLNFAMMLLRLLMVTMRWLAIEMYVLST